MEVLVLGNEVLLRGNRGAAERWREALEEKEGKTRTISAHTGSRDLGTLFFQERRQVEAAAMQDSEWGESLPKLLPLVSSMFGSVYLTTKLPGETIHNFLLRSS